MFPFAISFLLGVCIVLGMAQLPSLTVSAAVLVVCVLVARFKLLRLPAAVGFGFCWVAFSGHLALADRLPADMNGITVELAGDIVSLPEKTGDATRFIFAPFDTQWPRRIRLSWYGAPPSFDAAQRWKLTVKLRTPRGFSNAGGFDYEAWLLGQGIGATGYVSGAQALNDDAVGLLTVRSHLSNRIDRVVGEHSQGDSYSGLIRALAVADRGGLGSDEWQVLARSGVGHLFAISGLHVGLVAAWVGLLALWGWRRSAWLCSKVPAPVAAAILALVAAALYAALAGFTVPTRRAIVMLSIVLGAVILRRNVSAWPVFGAALLVVLLIDPLSPLAYGFWLSFGAVAVILFIFSGRVSRPGWLVGLVKTQLLLSVFLVPIWIQFFQQIPLTAPLLNLVAVPLFSIVVVPLTLLGTIIPGFVGDQLLLLVVRLFDCFWPALSALANQPEAAWATASRPLPLFLLAIAGLIVFCMPRGMPLRLLGVVALLPFVLWQPDRPEPGDFRLALLDVGQGLAAVVETAEHTLVYDTGPRFRSGSDTGMLVVLPYLQSRSISSVDKLVVSHGDNDHRGGLESLRRNIDIQEILASEPEADSMACVEGQSWHWDGVSFEVLHPKTGDTWTDSNNRSCVLRVAGVQGSLLLTGDIERDAEKALFASARDLSATVLQAPHHGSKSSSSTGFIDAVSPETVLFAAGYANRWGMPADEVVKRYLTREITPFNTANDGMIVIEFDSIDGVGEPILWRKENQRWWHAR